ncbi:MAG: exo-alpha-sialidase [Gammaproteobacteria bacterium]|nr:exo-alpha-sialidase [Gammaproteobacteria bacterium]
MLSLLIRTALALTMTLTTVAHAEEPVKKKHDMAVMWQTALTKPPIAVSAAFDSSGRLWLAKVENGYVLVSHSDDTGKTFNPAVKVNTAPERIAAEGENRPKVAVAGDGTVYISYTEHLDQPFSGNVRFSRSLDGGKSFSVPIIVNDNRETISHRFDTLGVDAKGKIYLAWLDKREASAAQKSGERYAGAALYYAESDNRGDSFSTNKRLASNTCECCRVAMAMDTDDVPVIFWRHIYDNNVRDHAVLRLGGKGGMMRVNEDNWQIDACPHHGGAISVGGDGAYHVVWFTNAPQRKGLFYARSSDQGKTFSTPMPFGDHQAQAGHPHVLAQGENVFIAWKEFDGQRAAVYGMASQDQGSSWSKPVRVADTAGASDHPLLIGNGKRAFLSWNTVKEGWRLIDVAAP